MLWPIIGRPISEVSYKYWPLYTSTVADVHSGPVLWSGRLAVDLSGVGRGGSYNPLLRDMIPYEMLF